jgi:hypothetical protein
VSPAAAMAERFDLLRRLARAGVMSAGDLDSESLGRAVAAGHVAQDDSFCFLTAEGEAALNDLYAHRVPAHERAAAESLLDTFTVFDPELKRIAQAWQLRPDGTKNVHDDATYDTTVLTQLFRLDDEVQLLLRGQPTRLAEIVVPFADELAAARAAVEAGQADRFTSPDDDSYHSVWFRLHEDLLRTLGRRRTE